MPDIDISFDVNPINGELATVTSDDSIKQRITTLVKTGFYERLMWPSLGCQARSSLFELYSRDLTEFTIRQTILSTIRYQEPLVKDVEVVVDFNDIDSVSCTVTFVVRNSNRIQQVDVFLERLR